MLLHNTVKHRYSEQALNEFRLVVKVSLIFSLVLKEIIKTYYRVYRFWTNHVYNESDSYSLTIC